MFVALFPNENDTPVVFVAVVLAGTLVVDAAVFPNENVEGAFRVGADWTVLATFVVGKAKLIFGACGSTCFGAPKLNILFVVGAGAGTDAVEGDAGMTEFMPGYFGGSFVFDGEPKLTTDGIEVVGAAGDFDKPKENVTAEVVTGVIVAAAAFNFPFVSLDGETGENVNPSSLGASVTGTLLKFPGSVKVGAGVVVTVFGLDFSVSLAIVLATDGLDVGIGEKLIKGALTVVGTTSFETSLPLTALPDVIVDAGTLNVFKTDVVVAVLNVTTVLVVKLAAVEMVAFNATCFASSVSLLDLTLSTSSLDSSSPRRKLNIIANFDFDASFLSKLNNVDAFAFGLTNEMAFSSSSASLTGSRLIDVL